MLRRYALVGLYAWLALGTSSRNVVRMHCPRSLVAGQSVVMADDSCNSTDSSDSDDGQDDNDGLDDDPYTA